MIRVHAESEGATVVDELLAHGDDPRDLLRSSGWEPLAVTATGALGDLVLSYAVRPARPDDPVPAAPAPAAPPADLDRPRVRRVAAYAVVRDGDRVLLTELAPRTTAPGRWTLPGGGVDEGEDPISAVVREVFEETGQVVDDVRLVTVVTTRAVGPSPWGERDYHAVRLIHTARCVRPGEPVVHDVGGSTSSARWVALSEVSTISTVSLVDDALAAVGLSPG